MKRFTYLALFLVLGVLFTLRGQSFAQGNDTLVIYATPITISLDSVINHDQAQATHHHVYVLASADTPYAFVSGVVVNDNVTIVGKLGTNGRPPCVEPDPSTSLPTAHDHLFTFTKNGSVVILKNLYLLGIATDGSINEGDGFGVTVNGDSIHLIVNNVVFEQWSQFAINYSGNWDKLTITNTEFRNLVNPGSDYTGEAIRFRNDLNRDPQDSVVIKDCTFLGINGYVACVGVTGYIRLIDFEHNTVVGVYKNPFFSMNATNWINQHNIYYAAYAGGMANGEYPWWDRIWAPGAGAVIDLDTLNKPIAGAFGIDTSASNWVSVAEAARNIQISDNIYFMPASITSYVTAWDDTAHGLDSIYTCGWINAYTEAMFANHSNFHANGNLVGTDPGYGAGIIAMIGATGTTVPSGDGIGLLPWLMESRTSGDVATQFWGYQQAIPDFSSGNWEPTWPLPEATSNDLKYSASLTATDGQYYGDTRWFGVPLGVKPLPQSVPAEFQLSNNYPNPFNPSTNISFTVDNNGPASLKIYNLLGQLVMTVYEGNAQVHQAYSFNVNMDRFASGVYFYTLQQASNSITKKLLLLK
ncbi:MAG TPA: T9SS type A sorting domain-containing protein [Candidatus Acidoferrales bacterium]|nr:T9SS type A sorting domain-containing protein [Candidatus Acidoferrales bacterium]